MQFVYIDERDRDAIVNHIAKIQLKRIRLLRERYLFRGSYSDKDASKCPQKFNLRVMLYWTAAVLVVILVAASLIGYFWSYAHNHPKGEIEQLFEDAIKKYRDR